MTLSEQLEGIFDSEKKTTLSLIIEKIGGKSFGLSLILLALPAALPIPATGYGTPFGIALFGIGVQMLLKRNHLWIPASLGEKESPITKGSKTLNRMINFVKLFEKVVKPRIKRCTQGIGYRFLGLLVALCGLSMILPLPLTNTIPAFGIFVIGLGLLEEDGIAAIIGACISITGIALTGVLIYFVITFGLEGIEMLKNILTGYLA